MSGLLTVTTASGGSLGGPATSPKTVSSLQKTTSASTLQPAATAQYYQPTAYPGIQYAAAGGGGGGSGATDGAAAPAPVYVDPYADWGGKAAYDTLVNKFDNQKNTIYDTVGDAAKNTGSQLNQSILDLVDSIRTGQDAIDNRGINAELAHTRGVSDVYGGISRGIQSAGTLLANRNASNSSAAEAIARAYAAFGQRQMSDIGNQYNMEERGIGQDQTALGRQSDSGRRHILASEDQSVNSIVSDAQNKLAALDAAMADASLPDRLNLDAEKNKVRTQVLGALAKYDDMLSTKVDAIDPMSMAARMTQANKLAAAGTAPADAFSYTADAPLQMQNTGPVASNLPIYTSKRRKQ